MWVFAGNLAENPGRGQGPDRLDPRGSPASWRMDSLILVGEGSFHGFFCMWVPGHGQGWGKRGISGTKCLSKSCESRVSLTGP